jgi:beclin 1
MPDHIAQSMNCQKCRQPLRLDNSLDDLNPAAYDLLVGMQAPTRRNLPSERDANDWLIVDTNTASSSSPQSQPKSAAPRSSVAHPQDDSRKVLYDKAMQSAGPPIFRRHHGGPSRDSAMSFIYLTESQMGHPQPESKDMPPSPARLRRSSTSRAPGGEHENSHAGEMDRINRLFEILSARSDIDHPICIECTDMLVEGLQKKLDAATKERDAYVKHLKNVQTNQPSQEEIKAQQAALKQAQKDQAAAMAELEKLEKEKDALDAELLTLEQESRQLDKEEETFWRERNAFASKMEGFQAERDSVNTKYSHDSRLLEKLQRSNVYNDTFCISHDGSFATINGLRLGRLSSKPVDWPEINAAWGHALLLLVTVSDKLGYKFQGYVPQPLGSTSKIVKTDSSSPESSRLGSRSMHAPAKKQTLELYSSGDMPLGLTFMHRKFDNAMVAFLELVRQLGVFVQHETERRGNPLSLPYKIEGDKIGDVSIKLGIAQDDGWTKACKLTLTCCKFLLAHASNVSSSSRNNATVS